MEFQRFSFYAVMLIVFYLYRKLYLPILKKEGKPGRIILIISTVILFIVNFNLINDYWPEEISDTNYISPIIVTTIFWAITHFIKFNSDTSSIFRAEKEDTGYNLPNIYKSIKYKDVTEFINDDIPIYPRITVFYHYQEDDQSRMIFDSSDFEIITKELKTYEDSNLKQLYVGRRLLLNKKWYKIEKIKIDILDFFDDYSTAKSDLHSGVDTPYNIQISLTVN